ncbi:M67 family metallopeptidase [Paenibacillus sp. LHD-38]|uniref:M67 family metallopeptidase n=1 Tax=Paenibacillus sp. LHD-38 TaxID=3072143 RepID=UPI00280DE712|nr:M67 family metallopeptidase [Paenibacillus sp. LHD-38]MDQ8736235.1 M67 family metallopeptidase [Paenibacillus sp. LHD-38]
MEAQQSKGMITKSAYDLLISICKHARPMEACGILVSSRESMQSENPTIIDTIIPITNKHIDPTHSFTFDPAEWTAAYFEMQKNRQTLVGLFHSHPRTEAIPSSSDSEGFLPASELSYWIVSLRNIETPHVQPYRRTEGAFIPMQLVLA